MSKVAMVQQLKAWLIRHLQTMVEALGRLVSRPFATLMTAAVIGIALALPTGLHLILQNLQNVVGSWDSAAQISLFMRKDVSTDEARRVADTLRQRTELGEVEFVSHEQALEEFRELSGFGDALSALEENPLPNVIIIKPSIQANSSTTIQTLLAEMRDMAEVDIAQLDMNWVKRLYALMAIGQRAVIVLGCMLAMAVLLVVGNTIRLAILNRRDEIVIIKMIGGTDAFIRRPFLYAGFWYGLLGGVIAAILVEGAITLLSQPVSKLAALYNSGFYLQGMGFGVFLIVLFSAVLLGLGGSWLAVGRHLKEIEPS